MAWSADSSYLVSASKDSTIKLWAVKDPKKALHTLPGHEDEVGPCPDCMVVRTCLYVPICACLVSDRYGSGLQVYALDWSPSGAQVASGSKDRTLKIWHH